MMLFIAIPWGTSQSFKFNIWCCCTVKSIPRNLCRQLKWSVLHREYVEKKYCKTHSSCAINRYTWRSAIPFASHIQRKEEKKKGKRPWEPLWCSGLYVNIADRSSSLLHVIKQGLWKVGPHQFKIFSSAFLAPVLAEFLNFQLLSLGSVLQVLSRAGTSSSYHGCCGCDWHSSCTHLFKAVPQWEVWVLDCYAPKEAWWGNYLFCNTDCC